MVEEELKQMDKEELLGVIKAQKFEIERLNNIIKELKNGIKNFFYNQSNKTNKYIIDLLEGKNIGKGLIITEEDLKELASILDKGE